MRVARTLAEVEELRSAWIALQPGHPDADIDVFLAVCELRDEVERPHVVVLEDEHGAPVALAAARLEHTRLLTRVGYRTVLRPRLRSLTVVYGGLLGPSAAHGELVAALDAALCAGEADVLRVCGRRPEDPLTRRLRSEPPRWRREHGAIPGPRYSLRLRPTMEEYWRSRSKKGRGDARRLQRRRDEAFGDRLEIRRIGPGADVDRLMDDLEEVSAKTYHRGLGVGFARTPLQRRVIELGLERDTYSAWIMYLDGRPVAFADGTRTGETFHLGLLGFDPDPELHNLGIGSAVVVRTIEDLTQDPRVQLYDFGFGENYYKRRFGDESFEESDVLVFAPRLRAITANGSRSAVLASVALAKRALGDERIAGLRRRWRSRLSTAAQGASASL